MIRFVHMLFWLTLTLWVAAVILPGAAGISAFIELPERHASIDTYSAYFGDDTKGMGRLVAGFVIDPLFVFTNIAQWILAPAACVLALFEWRPLRTSRGFSNWVRLFALFAALGLVLLHNIAFAPAMAADLAAYRAAAAANEAELADAAYARFDQYHLLAERLFGLRFLCLILAVCASAISTAMGPPRQEPAA